MKPALIISTLAFSLTIPSAIADVTTIAFGSCIRAENPQPFWDAAIESKPDMFLMLGDNIYADTTDPRVMQKKYQELADNPGYQKLNRQIPVYATWDDHDYGQNDAGSENPIKKASEQQFLDFFNFPPDSPARTRPGIYHAHLFGSEERRLQLIMLDTRYFRGPAIKKWPSLNCPATNYGEQLDPGVSLLGEAQWQWLEEQLSKPAAIRIIATSIQLIPDQHCWEKWANFPLERKRLFDLIAKMNAFNTLFISGDRHLAELSRYLPPGSNHPFYELTSSSLNASGAGKDESNRYRIGHDNIRLNNFGLIKIDWEEEGSVELQLRGENGKLLLRHTLKNFGRSTAGDKQ